LRIFAIRLECRAYRLRCESFCGAGWRLSKKKIERSTPGAPVVLSMLAKRGRQNGFGGMHRNCYTDRASFKQFEVTANNLKIATKKVDDSAALVEIALKTLAAA
jgi:hypothetical protein